MLQHRDRPWRILTINNLYPPQELGGYGRSIADFADCLVRRGHDVRVLTAQADYLGPIAQPEPNIDRRLQLWGTYEGSTRAFEDWQQIQMVMAHNDRLIRAAIADYRPDVCLLGNISFLGMTVVGPLLEAQIPVVHHLGFAVASHAPQEMPPHPLYHLAVASDYVRDCLLKEGYPVAHSQTIYPGAFVHQFYQPTLPPHDRLRIGYAGLVIPTKGPHVLLEALARLAAQGIAFDCSIAGKPLYPDYFADLQRYLQQVGLADRVRFVGQLNRQQLIQFHRRHNVLVFPSIEVEAFGITQVEAMAAGATLITTGVGGSAEAIEAGVSGLRVPPNDGAALAEALASLPANRERWGQMAAAGQARAMQVFDIERSTDRLAVKFDELLSLRDAIMRSHQAPDSLSNPTSLSYMNWLFQRAIGCINLYRLNPTDTSTIVQLREMRQQLAQFWQTAPAPDLQPLYTSEAGHTHRQFLQSGFLQEPLNPEEQQQRDQLSQQARLGFQDPNGLKAFIGSMLYYAPGQMQVRDAANRLPQWLFTDYQTIFGTTPAIAASMPPSNAAPAQSSTPLPPPPIAPIAPIATPVRTATTPVAPSSYAEIAAAVESVEGWLVPGQEQYLFEKVRSLPQDATIVEIGSFRGRSTVAMAFACVGTQRKIYCIDTWDGNDSDFADRDFFQIWQDNVQRHGLLNYVVPLRGYSGPVLSEWQALTGGKPIDLIFIDGSHQYEDVVVDFQKSFPWIKPGGWMLFHDTQCGWVGVDQAWDEVAKHQLVQQESCSTIAAGRKPLTAGSPLPPPPVAPTPIAAITPPRPIAPPQPITPPQPIESPQPIEPPTPITPPQPIAPPASLQPNLAEDMVFLNRFLGCSNLYEIDPEEPETIAELRQLRRQVADFWLTIPAHQLETLFHSELGRRYTSFLKSGFQREPLEATERDYLVSLAQRVAAGLEQPGGLNALLGAMMYYPPDKMQVKDAATRLPAWLLPVYQAVFESAEKKMLS